MQRRVSGIFPLWIMGLFLLALLIGSVGLFLGWCLGAVTGWEWPVRSLLLLTLALFGRPILLRVRGWAVPPGVEPCCDTCWRVERPDGTSLYVEAHGPENAPTLLLTHGWGLNSTVWHHFRKHLIGQFRIVAWDLPGLGRSTGPRNGDFSIEKMAADLEAVLASCGESPVVLLGHSIGGMITLTFCRLFPEHLGSRVAGLVLENTTYTDPVRTIHGNGLMMALKRPVLYPLLYLQIVLSPLLWVVNWLSYLIGTAHLITHLTQFGGEETPEQLEFATRFGLHDSPAVLARGILAMFRYDATAVLPTIPIPALICTGGRDRVTLAEAGKTLLAQIPHAQEIHIAPSGHLTFLEHSEPLCQAVGAFGTACLQASRV